MKLDCNEIWYFEVSIVISQRGDVKCLIDRCIDKSSASSFSTMTEVGLRVYYQELSDRNTCNKTVIEMSLSETSNS